MANNSETQVEIEELKQSIETKIAKLKSFNCNVGDYLIELAIQNNDNNLSIQSKAHILEQKLDIRKRTWMFKHYRNCFVGSEAIQIIIDLKFASNTEDAIEFGNKLMDANIIEHVTNSRAFDDKNLFYHFTNKFHNQKIKHSQQSSNSIDHKSQDPLRTPFYLVESDYNKCTIPPNPITKIRACESVTKLEYGVKWTSQPKTCILMKKYRDKQIAKDLLQVAKWLITEKNVTIFVQPEVYENESEFKQFEPFDIDKNGENIDFMVVLGGDGTLLYLGSLFQKNISIPPVLSFARGSLGFLTPFDFKNYKKILTHFMTPLRPHWINIRMRLKAKVFRKRKIKSINLNVEEKNNNNNEINILNECYDNIYNIENDIENNYEIIYDYNGLNEVLIERAGTNAQMIMLELHVNRKKVTYVQADGLIISTPTGSTAYSVSAGGSLIAPNVPCIGLTPICPHTLSFRPVIVSDSSIIHITIPKNVRSYPKITLDGKFPFILKENDIIQIQASKYPLSTFKLNEFQHEWWGGLTEKFNWNVRELQK